MFCIRKRSCSSRFGNGSSRQLITCIMQMGHIIGGNLNIHILAVTVVFKSGRVPSVSLKETDGL